ncbi:MAG: DUF58 domain-containing protein [Pseudomonadota bacterium]
MSSVASGRTGAARFIDPKVLARISNLELLARTVVDGFVSGLHVAAHLGNSTDFAEHRAYVPGDDVRRIDWRVFARTDRLYVKTFEAQTNTDLIVALDTSASMNFGSGEIAKFDYARFIAATLVYLAARQRDRVGLMTFDATVTDAIPAATRHRDKILRTLPTLTPHGAGDLGTALSDMTIHLKRRGMVVVISDFYDEPNAVATALDELRVRGHDIIALHVLDPLERNFALDTGAQPTVIEDLETGERMPLIASALQDDYQTLVSTHLADLEKACGSRRIDYAAFSCEEPLDAMLFHYLSRRARLARTFS